MIHDRRVLTALAALLIVVAWGCVVSYLDAVGMFDADPEN